MVFIDRLSKQYGAVTALDDLTLHLAAGQVHAMLGPNGAGKTTTVRILATLTRPTSGTATIGGYDVTAQPLEVKRQIGVVHQTLNFDPELTGEESLLVHGMLYGMPRGTIRPRMGELIEFAGLADAVRRKVSTYSGGMKRRLSIARAMMHEPRVVLLDEPTVGLDAHARRRVWDLVRRLRSDGCTVVLTTHHIEEAEVLADHVVIIDRGRVIAEGSPGELIARSGKVAVDYSGHGGTETAFFETREDAAGFVSKLDGHTTIRHANLEDVFIRLTGRRVSPNEQEGEGTHAPGHGSHTARTHHS
ncbi:MAG: Daunorubicin/doxorubicin resistance ATP-binding protein DrrA [Syntrophorhabdaceae bacterium PtaU1.Bin034]|jgi:ABC-2 type transport system ATP-binding protein|nr:MAG: Daunorubicin/doxorubicin resistance ATP-binding protein DrrA [Syntrophorhabdaceae bacterium PtaU1.Bin034]